MKRLVPQHLILSCDLGSGACQTAHRTPPPAQLWARVLDFVAAGTARLSTPPLAVGDRLIAIGHFRTDNIVYEHFFYAAIPLSTCSTASKPTRGAVSTGLTHVCRTFFLSHNLSQLFFSATMTRGILFRSTDISTEPYAPVCCSNART